MPWQLSPLTLAALAILFPPAGLLLWWFRPGLGRGARLLGSMAILTLGVVELFKVYGMRVELDGSGSGFIFSFGSTQKRDAAIEAHRAAQQQQQPQQQQQRSEPAPAAAATPARLTAPPVTAAPVAEVAVAKPGVASPAGTPVTAKPAAAAEPPPPAPAPSPSNYWTDFRGPNRAGIYAESPILTSWPEAGLKRLWKQPAGGGYASFTIANGLAYTIEQRRDSEVVAAYDVATGRERWTNSWKAHFSESMGGDGPRATPVFDSGRVYALGAEGELRVLDAATGSVVWKKNILADNGATNLTWAMAASPLVVDGKVIVLPGGQGGKSVVAYDKSTGERVWSVLDDDAAYASPTVAALGGKRQLLVVSAQRVMGLAIEDGALLWEVPWVTEYNANTTVPLVVSANRFFLSSGYDHGAMVVELTPSEPKWTTRIVWQNKRMKNKFNDSVLFEGHVYGLDDGILACVDVETGTQKWKGGRYGFGQVLLASGHLVVLSERGELALVKADPAGHKELARFDAISGKTWNNPAIAGGILLVRNASEMAAFRIGAAAE